MEQFCGPIIIVDEMTENLSNISVDILVRAETSLMADPLLYQFFMNYAFSIENITKGHCQI